jgi:3-phenylpropionate/trans-cinnamate dioxygenase ferredoxin subunit
MRFVVAPVSEFESGTRRTVRVGGREIGVFRVGERFFAVRNRCPHQGGPLCVGPLRPTLVSNTPGVIEVDESRLLIECPWHGWRYDVRTGEAYAPGDPHVRAYDVSVEEGGAVGEARFVAETFPVSVENEYVVLDA